MDILIYNLKYGLMITTFVFVMMMFIDYISVLTKGKMNKIIKGGVLRQYIMASFLAATPGCLGAFMDVSFYIHGIISFGAIAGSMIATSGDEAFVMLAMFPDKALILFGILFLLSIGFAYVIDKIMPALKIKLSQGCQIPSNHIQKECRCLNFKETIEHLKKISLTRFLLLVLLAGTLYGFISGVIGPRDWNWMRITFVSILFLASFIVITVPDHYLEEHIWKHIVKKHIWRIFLWSFGILLATDIGLSFWNLEELVKANMVWVLLLSGLIGIIPESGPHLIFVMMFAKGVIPFSVLLTSSIVQDGHGILPLLSYSLKDSLLIKLFNLIIGLGLGSILLFLGY